MPRLLLLALLALGLAACQAPDAEPPEPDAPPTRAVSDRATDRAALEAMTAAYQTAIRAGDHATIAALYADDAVVHPANRPAERGRGALDAFFEATDSEPQELSFTTTDLVVAESGDMAYEVGTVAGPDGAGKYLTVYRRTPDGWRIAADAWSGDAPPSAPEG